MTQFSNKILSFFDAVGTGALKINKMYIKSGRKMSLLQYNLSKTKHFGQIMELG